MQKRQSAGSLRYEAPAIKKVGTLQELTLGVGALLPDQAGLTAGLRATVQVG